MSFTVYPAIDVREGRVVRLQQGDFNREQSYAVDPESLATDYATQGATWLHVVDLDASKTGEFKIGPVLRRVSVHQNMHVQIGGGVRNESDIRERLAAGASRVVVGTTAVREPERVIEWIEKFGAEHICVALDTRQSADGIWRLPIHGWTEDGGAELFSLLTQFAGAGLKHLLCTDIARDGMLGGVNAPLYGEMAAQFPSVLIQASGGVKSLGDIRVARAAGACGVVVGKALLENRFSMSQALQC